ncbi:VirB3 family type IV secretion system protein [uncultured Sphingomonas sp.]|uniref:type IV secretion system protein VirB3 n=1 Tax=uncultured Sphingomonas sp. TaxID=158754 RepID=UPI0025E198AA|nr:VirB3 family type IV secretion system protein [uncultured Sphingomonas sp.]
MAAPDLMPLDRCTVFIALTRPQMFAGVTYSLFIVNAILAAELFLLTRSVLTIAVAVALHLAGAVLSLREPRFLDLWIIRLARTPRLANHGLWGCNSYRP